MMHGGGQRSFVSDEVKSKKPKLWIIKRLAGYFKPYIWIVLAATLMLMIVSALQIVPPYLTKVAIDKYIATKNFTGIYKIAGIYLLV